jgi:hypothetical protein
LKYYHRLATADQRGGDNSNRYQESRTESGVLEVLCGSVCNMNHRRVGVEQGSESTGVPRLTAPGPRTTIGP